MVTKQRLGDKEEASRWQQGRCRRRHSDTFIRKEQLCLAEPQLPFAHKGPVMQLILVPKHRLNWRRVKEGALERHSLSSVWL
jgi:hypothetical protein